MGVRTPPYRIETERLVIRCYEPEDAPLLKAAVDSSIEHLLPWMPWARFEPQSLDEKVELCRMFRGQFDLDENYVYAIFTPDETEQLGGSGFHKRAQRGLARDRLLGQLERGRAGDRDGGDGGADARRLRAVRDRPRRHPGRAA